MTTARSGGQVLVDQLRIQGVDRIFAVPGESYLAIMDALVDAPEIAFTVCRQEVGAAHMAETYGKLTGRPGVCFVTRGPGATHASAGCHIAFQDSTPMVLFIGQVQRDFLEREAFQEVDYHSMFSPLAKWVVEIDSAMRVPELVARAFHTATSGRPGPVVVSLPEDMLTDTVVVSDARTYHPTQSAPSVDDMDQAATLLAKAERPLVVVGGGTWSNDASASVEAFADTYGIPVCTSFRCQDYVNNDRPWYIGHLGIGVDDKLAARVKSADVLLVLGARLGEITTSGYTLVQAPVPTQTLIHVHPDPNEIGRVYQPTLGIASGMHAFTRHLQKLKMTVNGRWAEWGEQGRADYKATLASTPPKNGVDLAEVIRCMRNLLADDAIVTNGAGNYSAWIHRYFAYRQFRTQLAPTNGAMGYGVPSAVAAKLVHPDRTVVSINGDGCFLMCANEIATAIQYDAAPVFIVINNGMYGTIRMHQEKRYPTRVFGTDLKNPDFVALAQAFGAHAECVEDTDGFPAALERALTAGHAALIEVRTDPEYISPKTTISRLRGR